MFFLISDFEDFLWLNMRRLASKINTKLKRNLDLWDQTISRVQSVSHELLNGIVFNKMNSLQLFNDQWLWSSSHHGNCHWFQSCKCKSQKLPCTIFCACHCSIDCKYEKTVHQWIRMFPFHSLVMLKEFWEM